MNAKKKGESGQILHMKRVSWLTGPSAAKSSSRLHRSHPYGRYGKGGLGSTTRGKAQETENTNRQAEKPRKHKNTLNKPNMYPKFNQVFLAFSTLLFFASFECLLFMIFSIQPGMIARSFSKAKCTIIQKTVNSNISCFSESFVDHGKKLEIPCLQVYVIPVNNNDNKNENISIQANLQNGNTNGRKTAPLKNNNGQTDTVDCENNCSTNKPKSLTTNRGWLLYQNEYNYAGMDHRYRRCSYLPSVCHNDVTKIKQDICDYAFEVGEENSTIDCFVDEANERVILNKKIAPSDIVHAILWPALGVITSVGCCIGFWKRNHKHISRLYIYNSWAAS